jgi:hypothetical protein
MKRNRGRKKAWRCAGSPADRLLVVCPFVRRGHVSESNRGKKILYLTTFLTRDYITRDAHKVGESNLPLSTQDTLRKCDDDGVNQ